MIQQTVTPITLPEETRIGTRYTRSVRPPPDRPPSSGLFVVKPSATNGKLGRGGSMITKGPFRGLPLYSLTLEERATCWSGCQNWTRCYGDNMPFAHRYEPGPDLEMAILCDLLGLTDRHPRGFVMRLHVLGDFYSVEYVDFWRTQLVDFPNLRLFGYTHWPPGTPVGDALTQLVRDYPMQAAFRRSDGDKHADPLPVAVTISRDAAAAPGTVVCPEQTGRTISCTTCGLCMNRRTHISFRDHSRPRTSS